MGLLAEFEKRVSTKKLSPGMTLQGHRTLALVPNRGSFCPRAGASTLGQKLRGRKCPKDRSSPGAPALGEAMSCDTGCNDVMADSHELAL